MVELTQGDLLKQDAEALVNAVNCVGVMGRGIALQFRQAFPDNFKIYESACRRGEVRPGFMLVFETRRHTNPRYIINFPTKRHWRDKSRMADIESGLVALVGEIKNRGISSIAVPALGCGLGGLEWPEVSARIENAFVTLPYVHVWLFEPEVKLAPARLTNPDLRSLKL
jgi:O-acetyl-ADP-ribose deacetylase (regulator of RNase III)